MIKGANWGKSRILKDRLKLEGKLGAGDTFEGRPIIHRDSPIDGGVYLGQGKREAIVVDSEKYFDIKGLYRKAKQKTYENGAPEINILRAVYDTVAEALESNDEKVDKLISENNAGNDEKVALDSFIKKGIGVCRQQALTCGALLELFKKEGIIHGEISVDRNSTDAGSHAWCRYKNPAGWVFILDVAQKYMGSLGGASAKNRWPYKRPEDI